MKKPRNQQKSYVYKTDSIVYNIVRHNRLKRGEQVMNFYSVRDLRSETKNMWTDLRTGDDVILTNNGKPSAMIINIPEGGFDDVVQAVRQAKAMIALNSMRKKASRLGFRTEEEIDSIIRTVRNDD